MTEENFLTILGLGNILLQDEGFGVHFVRWFEKKYQIPEGVKAVEGGTLGYGLLDTVCSCRKLIVIDALKANDEPGSVYRFTKEEIDAQMLQPTSAHEVSFQDVLCKAELIEELPDVIFLCIVPYEYKDMGLEMTPHIRKKFPEVEKLLLKELCSHGINPLKLNNA
ncbi:MAG: HyaD/HybD family hydrogenase maturation endopeptidase [Acidobacteriia bacterium]|jgi:hydrogenase maturation protease|nr:HyaD/HybD family hydrogenase maturation endopeptidase [Terriglobia bacterium]